MAIANDNPPNDNPLGAFLKDRRARLDPTRFGIAATRRRTPGLRREEVAQRANVSATWYTWLEQGRGGAPSADVLDRLARALALNAVEREHLFLLAQHRPPAVRYQTAEGITPRLQRVLDSFEISPVIVKRPTWDVVGWNRAAAAVLADYGLLPKEERNVLRLIFSKRRSGMPNWESDARFAVATLRAEAARTGASGEIKALVDDLSRLSPDFARLWRASDVMTYGEGTKTINHPIGGRIALEYSTFAVDGRPDLGMIVFNPATPEDAERIRGLLKSQSC